MYERRITKLDLYCIVRIKKKITGKNTKLNNKLRLVICKTMIHHNYLGFIHECKVGLTFQKSINVISHVYIHDKNPYDHFNICRERHSMEFNPFP